MVRGCGIEMKEPKPINWEEAVGKTVSGVHASAAYLVMSFSDGTYAAAEAGDHYLDVGGVMLSSGTLLQAGAVDQEWVDALEKERVARELANKRATFERLKRELGEL